MSAPSAGLAAAAEAAGYRLVPERKLKEPMDQLVAAQRARKVDAVIDGGANTGQYATSLREAGWAGPILSIEPQPEPHAALVSKAQGDPLWQVLPPLALTATTGTAALHRSAESDMSSLLPQSTLLESLSPTSRILEQLTVATTRLDALRELVDASWRRLFVKLDLQGGEAVALEGAAGLIHRVAGFQLEMPLVPLYQGEASWREIVAWMDERGYSLHLVFQGYYDRHMARHLQVDGIFFGNER